MTEIKVIVDDEGHDVDAVFEEKIEVGGGGGIVKETDPTVADWAKQKEKPEYTYEEIKEKPDLVEDIGSSLAEETNVLTIELKDKSGKVIASTEVTIPKSETPDLSAYVKNTDIATASKAGVIKYEPNFGIYLTKDGIIKTAPAQKAAIDAKKNTYEPITPKWLDYAVKVGVTTNTEELTDDEKTSARTWLGAVGEEDYASMSKAGVVFGGQQLGININANGKMNIMRASDENIKGKTDYYKPIVSANAEMAVMYSLADCKDETLWTDDSTVDGQVVKGTKTKARELLGAVGFTDLATKEKAGVVKVNKNNSGLQMVNGELKLYPCSPVALTFRPQTGVNYNEPAPVTVGNVNEAVKATLTDDKKIILTEEEKAEACKTIGATKLYLHEVATPSGKIAIVNKYSVQYATVDDLSNNVWGQSTDLSTHFPVSSKLLNFSLDEPVLPLFHVHDHGTSIALFSIDSQSADSGVYNGFISYTIEKTAEITDTVTEL